MPGFLLGRRVKCSRCPTAFALAIREPEYRRMVNSGPKPVMAVRGQGLRRALVEMLIAPANLARVFRHAVDRRRYGGGRVGLGDVVAGSAHPI